ncbi:MAG: 23S rRNA (pseudouridine(1915)-N(3))-methyltransferase RlmH [Lachnospiraceae bacterium]|nr:23S rRNA (pseudouridine(1915)-N(3))-methyltransferase RlmH [Lachnospiraceae bacterium]MDN4742617.1 23S rRNA (pseudouridine(1915)-N(3))-methyltransferase RlmH [Lachnospiraceae bacterium C1.1]
MKITVLCAGKIKEKFYQDAIAEYNKRLSRYCKSAVIEVADGPDMYAEAERFLARLPEDAYIITLEIGGKKLNSVELSEKIEKLGIEGKSHICFIIGGSDGLAEAVLKKSDFALSFSDMTFPHQLMRVILFEQIYRSFKIIANEPYHK